MSTVNYQTNIFGEAIPVFPDCPVWLEKCVVNIYTLHENNKRVNSEIAVDFINDDRYLQLQYWKEFDGLGTLFDEAEDASHAFIRFERWWTEGKFTSPELIGRSRRWLTQDREGGPYIEQSVEAKKRREKNAQIVRDSISRG